MFWLQHSSRKLSGIGHSCVCPKGADYQWGKDPLEQLMVRFDSWRAVRSGNWLGWNLVTKSTIGGRATWRAVTCVKLEQASKAVMWMPTRRFSGEGRADPEETRRGSAPNMITIGTDWATGVVSTARQEGSLRQWGRPGMAAGSRPANEVGKDFGPSGCRRGSEVPRKPGNAGGGKDPRFWQVCEEGRTR
jgi:hypothetical protein